MKTSVQIQPGNGVLNPYPVSFIDKLIRLIAQQALPYSLTYFGLFVIQSLAIHILIWIDGWRPPFSFSPIVLLFPLWLWLPLAIMTHLNRVADEALTTFSTLLDCSQEDLAQLRYEFSTLPVRGVVINLIFWDIVYLFLVYLVRESFYVSYGLSPMLSIVITLMGLISYSIGSVIYYHSLRHLRLVNRIVKMVKNFNLFQLEPVYAFSKLTAQTGIAWIVLLSLTLLTFPIEIAPLPVIAFLLVQTGLSLAAFVLPIWFVNQRLVGEKRHKIADLNRRTEVMLERLHQALDRHTPEDYEKLNDALASLEAEGEILKKISTWPWRQGMFAGFLSAIVLPIVLFLLQLALGNFLGG
jgi:hypothetical protein